MNIALDSWRYLHREADFVLYSYVILENHIHLIASPPQLNRDIQRFESYTAKEIINEPERRNAAKLRELLELFKRCHKQESRYQVWEEGSHPQMIESETVMRQKLEYIHQKPMNRGYVDLPEHWRYSGARVYADQEGLIDVTRAW